RLGRHCGVWPRVAQIPVASDRRRSVWPGTCLSCRFPHAAGRATDTRAQRAGSPGKGILRPPVPKRTGPPTFTAMRPIARHRGKTMAEARAITIPTEPIGSIPRPVELIRNLASHDADDPDLAPLYEHAVRDTIARFEATGSPVITDGEQRKYRDFSTYCVHG